MHRNFVSFTARRVGQVAALVLSACSPADPVEVAAATPESDAAAEPDAAAAPPGADSGGVLPAPDAAPDATNPGEVDDGGPRPPDGGAATMDAAPPGSDAAAATADARVAPPDPDAVAASPDALPPAPDAFVHVLPEAGRPDAALTIADRLAACDADPRLAGRLAVDESGWGHVPAGTEVAYAHNPPASGPHYGQWARSAVYAEPLERRNWVHNLEHGWLVLLHRPDAPPAAVQVLVDAWNAGFADAECPAGPVRRVLVTPDPLLPTPVAAVTAYRALAADRLEMADLEQMFALCRVAAPEVRACGDGQVPAPPSAP
jgi:hypothetical protein